MLMDIATLQAIHKWKNIHDAHNQQNYKNKYYQNIFLKYLSNVKNMLLHQSNAGCSPSFTTTLKRAISPQRIDTTDSVTQYNTTEGLPGSRM